MQKVAAQSDQTGYFSFVDELKQKAADVLADPQTWFHLAVGVGKIILVYVFGKMFIRFSDKAIHHMVTRREKRSPNGDSRRTNTLAKLARNVIQYVTNFVIILLVLEQLGVDLGPLIAGAGVAGLAIGFGAQNLVRDVITGFFIIFEDQFAVGDYIKTGQFIGTVEEVGLRVTKIRSWTGEIHIIPNGSITEVTNYSINNSIAVVDVTIAYEEDVEKAMEIIRETAHKVYEENENMVSEPEVLGVQRLGPSETVIRLTAECKPVTHFAVSRKLNAEIKKSLEAHGFAHPYPRLVTMPPGQKGEM